MNGERMVAIPYRSIGNLNFVAFRKLIEEVHKHDDVWVCARMPK